MNSISFWLTRFALVMLFLFVSALVISPLYTLFQGTLDSHTTIRTILTIVVVGWILLMLILAQVMASRMVFQGLGFMAALRLSIMEARVAVGFVPFIGRRPAPESDERRARENSPIE